MIKDSISEGGTHDIELCELCMVKCDKCHQCEPTNDGEEMIDEDGTEKWKCYKCMSEDEDEMRMR